MPQSNGGLRSSFTRSRERDEENYEDMLRRYQDEKQQRKEKEKDREKNIFRERERERQKEREKEREREFEMIEARRGSEGGGLAENGGIMMQDSAVGKEMMENRIRKGFVHI